MRRQRSVNSSDVNANADRGSYEKSCRKDTSEAQFPPATESATNEVSNPKHLSQENPT